MDMADKSNKQNIKQWFDQKPTRYLLIAVAMVLILVCVYFGTRNKRAEMAASFSQPVKIVRNVADEVSPVFADDSFVKVT